MQIYYSFSPLSYKHIADATDRHGAMLHAVFLGRSHNYPGSSNNSDDVSGLEMVEAEAAVTELVI